MQSLSNHQIQDHLLRSGFTKIPPKDLNNYKVIGFKKPHLHHPIYVKATNNFPLVIHDTYDAIRPKLLKIDGVHVDSGKEYYNSNMKEFNKKINPNSSSKNPTPTKFGLDFGFANTNVLQKFLEHLAPIVKANPMAKVSPEDVDDSFDESTPPTEKDAIIKARIGQGAYRKALLDYWNGCAVTGCTRKALLISSHIIPWNKDKEARLDPFNGLLLTPTLDRAFDNGLISFKDDGLILLSSALSKTDLELLHLDATLRLRKVDVKHLPYLAWHRANLFKS